MLLILLPAQQAHAQTDVVDQFYQLLESVSRGLEAIGEKSEDVIPQRAHPLPEVVFDFKNLFTTSDVREYEKPVPPGAFISIDHMYGEVRVQGGPEDVIRITADVTVGARGDELARTVLAEIETAFTKTEDGGLHIQTIYPDLKEYRVATELNYVITVPPRMAVTCKNLFGDTVVQGIDGVVSIDAQFGRVHVEQLNAPVTVRARGDLPLYAYWLREGGTFDLQATQAEFNHVGGTLKVDNYLGQTVIQDCTAKLVDARTEDGELHYHLVPGSQPDLSATTLFGDVLSDVPMEFNRRGSAVTGRWGNTDSAQRVRLESKLADIRIIAHVAEATGAPQDESGLSAQSLSDQVVPITPGTTLAIRGEVCNVIIEAHDDSDLIVSGEHFVLVDDGAKPDAVLDAIALDVNTTDSGIEVITGPMEDLSTLGARFYRTDLRIRCPRDIALRIRCETGRIRIADHTGNADVEIDSGSIEVDQVLGTLNLINRAGDITVVDSSGPLTATGSGGVTRTRSLAGRQTVSMENGQAVIDAPGGQVNVFQNGGDVSVIAYDGIYGNFDLRATDGDVSVVHPDSASAEYEVTVNDGVVRSAWELTGTLSSAQKKFTGTLNDGQYRINIETTRGNVALNR